MRSFRDLPIRRKLVVIGWATSASALLASTVIFVISAYVLGRRNFEAGVEMLASITADNLTAAVAFKDAKTATETVQALRATPTVHLACAYGSDHALLAQLSKLTDQSCPPMAPPDQQWINKATVIVVLPILLEGRRVGTVYLEGNNVGLREQVLTQGVAAVFGALVGLALATWIAARLHREIADPVTSLSETAGQITREGNYAVRAKKAGHDEIGALVDAFNEMVASVEGSENELRKANRQKDEFLAALSHELRTPLNAIVGWLQILRANPRNPQIVDEAVIRLDRNARAQVRLIEDLLDISRIVSGKLELKITPVDLVAVVLGAVDIIRPSADAKHIQIGLNVPPPPCFVSGDADRLQQVLVNLLSNAVKFTPAEGCIDVTLALSNDDYTVVIRDNGIGITPDFLPRVFDRFRQADGSITRQHGGLGLGLAIAHDLVSLQGGKLSAASDGLGKGATFVVAIPRLVANAAPARESRKTSVRIEGLTVMVTDDDADARLVAREALAGAGARVVVADDAADALAVVDREDIDVFVCDLQMPDVDGYALLREIRDRGWSRGRFIPAVAVTAHAGVEEHTRARRAGYQAVVTKPYDFAVLAKAVADAVGE